jgi:hypothetical protein
MWKVLNLVYSINAGQVKAYNEVFTGHPYPLNPLSHRMLGKHLITFFKQVIKKPADIPTALIDLSARFGMAKAQLLAADKPNVPMLRCWEAIIRH